MTKKIWAAIGSGITILTAVVSTVIWMEGHYAQAKELKQTRQQVAQALEVVVRDLQRSSVESNLVTVNLMIIQAERRLAQNPDSYQLKKELNQLRKQQVILEKQKQQLLVPVRPKEMLPSD